MSGHTSGLVFYRLEAGESIIWDLISYHLVWSVQVCCFRFDPADHMWTLSWSYVTQMIWVWLNKNVAKIYACRLGVVLLPVRLPPRGCDFEALFFFWSRHLLFCCYTSSDGAGGVTLKQGLYFGGRIFVLPHISIWSKAHRLTWADHTRREQSKSQNINSATT